MKKMISVILAVLLMIPILPTRVFSITASAESQGTIGNCTWEVSGTCLTISGSGSMRKGGEQPSDIPWRDFDITEVVIEEGITEICDYAFYKINITKVKLPTTLNVIGVGAFQNSPLQEILIPGRVHTIGSYAFAGCDSLEHVWYSGDSTSKYNMDIFNNNGALINAEWHFICTSTHSYESDCDASCGECDWKRDVPDHIYDNDCDKKCNVCQLEREVPDHVYDNNSDVECNICGYVRYYTYTVSNGNATITDVDSSISGDITIPSTLGGYPVTSIGNSAFSGCNSLNNIDIPNSVINIYDKAFINCRSLTNVSIGDGVTYIGNRAFENCSSVIRVAIGSGVTYIGENAFYYCYSLKEVNIADIVTWCNIDFKNSSSNPLYNAHNLYINSELVTNLIIPDSVISISNYSFCNCTSLTNVTIGDSITGIGNYAFAFCSSLANVTIPNSVKSIGDSAFKNCTSLKKVFYRGSKEDKTKITIDSWNTALTTTTWCYNSCVGSANHSYDKDGICIHCGDEAEYILGDCNGDGNIDTTDLATLKLFLAGVGELSDTGKLGADLNGDGGVNTTDLAQLKLKLAGIE